MKREPTHPRITPMRALEMLQRMKHDRHYVSGTQAVWVYDEVCEALEHHVQAALATARRRKR